VTAWLLDTDILSELRRPGPEPKSWPSSPCNPSIGPMSVRAEIRSASNSSPEPGGARTGFRPMFEHRVLPVSEDVLFKATHGGSRPLLNPWGTPTTA
jgi:predicted nucleic acid-binding protein